MDVRCSPVTDRQVKPKAIDFLCTISAWAVEENVPVAESSDVDE